VTREEVIAHLTPLREDPIGTLVIGCRALRVVIHSQMTATPIVVGFDDHMNFRITENALVIEPSTPGASTRALLWSEIVSMLVGEPETSDGHLFQG
jgi:hypothetical protein